jgi:hypothetical protein
MAGMIIKSIFTPNEQRLFLTSEQEVMVILVDGAQAFTGLRGIKNNTAQFHHKCRTFRDSHQTWRALTTINSSCISHL